MNLIFFVALASDAYKEQGHQGEQLAVDYLKRKNYIVIAQNYWVRPIGEIDIIALQNDVVVAVEVKYWRRFSMRQLEYSIDSRKKKEWNMC